MIAFLHTLSTNVEKFEALVNKYDANIEVMHFVNEELLVYALASGKTDDEGFDKEVEKIKLLEPSKIICTCSSYGEACDRREDIERIDKPIAEYIVANYAKIGLAFAASSTYDISLRLLRNCAKEINSTVEITPIDASRAWQHYENKDFTQYYSIIADSIIEGAEECSAVFLAQASMEGAKQHLNDLSIEVFSSPEFGVKSFLSQI